MSSHMSNARRHARQSAKEIRSAARRVRDTAADEANGVMHTIHKVGNDAVKAARNGYEDLRDAAGDYVDRGRATAKSMEHSIENQIKERPLSTVLLSLGLGFLAGYVFARR